MKRLVFLLLFIFIFCSHLFAENLDTINNRVVKLFKQEKYSECYDLALDLYSKSKESTDSVLIFNSLYYMGFSNQRMGNMDIALEYNIQAYDVAQDLGMLDLQSSILNNIGNVYMVNDKDSLALVYFNKSIEIEKNLGRKSQLAVRYGNASTAYMKMGDYDAALKAAEEGLRIDKELGRPNKIAIRLNQLGDVYHACGRLEDATNCELEAFGYFKEANSKYGMSVVAHSLGDLKIEDKEIDSAIYYYELSMNLAKEINNSLLVQKVSKSLYKVYKKTNPELAIVFLERHVAIKDSLFNEKNQQMLNDFQVRYDIREKELEIEVQKKRIQYDRYILKLTSITIILLIVIIILLIINGINRKRRNAVLTELNEMKDRSLSLLSHDLKNPVIAQKLVLNQLNDNFDNIKTEDVKMYIESLTESVNSLEELLVNLLEWTKYEMNKIEYKPIAFDVRELCFEEVVPLFRSAAHKKRIVIRECDVKLNGYEVFSDVRMISTVLRNVISNALKFTQEGKEIILCFKDEGDSIRVIVKDSGVGISEERLKILLSGKSLTTLGTNGEVGSGLGLDLIVKMLELCGSKLNVKSESGIGSEFSFELKKYGQSDKNNIG